MPAVCCWADRTWLVDGAGGLLPVVVALVEEVDELEVLGGDGVDARRHAHRRRAHRRAVHHLAGASGGAQLLARLAAAALHTPQTDQR